MHPFILFVTLGALFINYYADKYNILYRSKLTHELGTINNY